MQNSVTAGQTNPAIVKVPVGRHAGKQCVDQGADVRVLKNGDRIESIVVTCACGQEITLNCDYETQPTGN